MIAPLRRWAARLLIFFGVLFLAMAFTVAIVVREIARDTGLDEALLPLFRAAYFIKEYHVEPIDRKKTKQHLLAGLIDNLDPHTAYLPPEETQSWQEDMLGSYGGLGIGLRPGKDKKTLVVRDVFEGGPASKAGLEPGDLIQAIDKEPVGKLSQGENLKRIRGPVGSVVTLDVQPKDGGARREVMVVRAPIELPIAQWTLLDSARGKILWLRQSNFGEDLVRQTAVAAIAAHKESEGKIVGILLDLRDNPGGLVSSAVGLSAFFGEPGALVVSSKGRDPDSNQHWLATMDDWSSSQPLGEDHVAVARRVAPWLAKAPMAVLVNRRSASASEIVAGALKDWKRAVVVGNDTFGKGSVQSVVPLGEGNGSMKVTTSRYYTPSGLAIQAVGVKVDVAVESALDRGLREADLPKHLKGESARESRGETLEIGPDGEPIAAAPIDVKDPKIAAELAMEEGRSTFSARLRPPGADPFVAAGVKALKL